MTPQVPGRVIFDITGRPLSDVLFKSLLKVSNMSKPLYFPIIDIRHRLHFKATVSQNMLFNLVILF